jgi:hypothetical protein
MSTIATIHRTIIAKVNRGHRAYGKTEIVGTSILRQIFGNAAHKLRVCLRLFPSTSHP